MDSANDHDVDDNNTTMAKQTIATIISGPIPNRTTSLGAMVAAYAADARVAGLF